MARDIARQAQRVGNALTSVRLDDLITSMAKGIAWGQYDLDKVGVEITRMMGVPGTVSVGDEELSMLDAGFLPSFYHFVDTLLELKMEVKIREEESTDKKTSTSYTRGIESTQSTDLSIKAKGKFFAKIDAEAKSSWSTKSTSAYTRTLDAKYAQKYSQELNASSLMRTKLVPKPAPDVLVERIKLYLEEIKEEIKQELAESKAAKTPKEIAALFQKRLFKKITDKLIRSYGI